MKLSEALQIAALPSDPGQSLQTLALVCGFTPLYLEAFLLASARTDFLGKNIRISSGLYGDLAGNLARAAGVEPDFAAVVLEWSDLDPRLGLRSVGGWSPESLNSILQSMGEALDRIEPLIQVLAAKAPVAFCPPTLPLPPISFTAGWEASEFTLNLECRIATFLERVIRIPGLRCISRQRLDEISPHALRRNPKMDLGAGFPYTTAHAGALADLLWKLLSPPVRKKGLITDLDDTLWSGILGEVGVAGVTWSQEAHTQVHALYQQTLASLARSGVLLGVASKNDLSLVKKALAREDILLRSDSIFPVEAHWNHKSESVKRILEAWNIGVDSVVFVDDSALELAEVHAKFPGITTLQFPRNQPEGVWNLIWELRDLFGRPQLLAEDRLRLDSLRATAEFSAATSDTPNTDFLASVDPEVVLDFSKNPEDQRAFELINKTNQFNLNGVRFTEAEWSSHLAEPTSFLLTASYQDKFGPLGRIGVMVGRWTEGSCSVDAWVLSCRAFSRLVEHQMLQQVFSLSGSNRIEFAYRETPRNGPLREFFEGILGTVPNEPIFVPRTRFESACPKLPHRIKEISVASNR